MFQSSQEDKEVLVHMDAVPREGEYVLVIGTRSSMTKIEGRVVSVIWSVMDLDMNRQCSAVVKVRVAEKFNSDSVEFSLSTHALGDIDATTKLLKEDVEKIQRLVFSDKFRIIIAPDSEGH